ncbi:MAG TPA: hypothetical protein VKC66_13335 [Xanthobacteraceae bacterium]|nr:hypothetical protein [Xanthobacteraceae bacterium]
MSKLGSMYLATGILGATVGAVAAEELRRQVVPDFAPTANTGWVLDHAVGVDDLLTPPTGGPGPVTFDKAHPYVPNGFGKQSTYRVADLSNPILKPWTIPSMKKANDEVLAGKVPFRARERCWPVGVPGFSAYSLVEPFFFYQMPDKVVVINQGGPEIRRIYLNVTHSKDVKPSWYGESVGHYENGDTLVIDTIGISPKSFVDNYRTPHTDQLHVVERWTLAADGQTVGVSVFVEDPGAFTMPWSAVQQWRRVENAPISTAACNENNGDFFNEGLVPLPEAAAPDF